MSCDRAKVHAKPRSPWPWATSQSQSDEFCIDFPEAIAPLRWHKIIECSSVDPALSSVPSAFWRGMACKQAYQPVQRQLVLGTPSAVPIVSALCGVPCIVLSTSNCINGLVLLLLDPLYDGKLSHSSVSPCPRDHRPWWLSQDLNLGKVLYLAPEAAFS